VGKHYHPGEKAMWVGSVPKNRKLSLTPTSTRGGGVNKKTTGPNVKCGCWAGKINAARKRVLAGAEGKKGQNRKNQASTIPGLCCQGG